MLLDHVEKLISVGNYAAPADQPVTPFRIPDGVELIEIMTGGQVFFDLDGVEQTFRRGAIFWHHPGEETICRTPPEDPYRCTAIRFKVAAPNRPAGRVSQWKSPDAAVEFTAEVMRAFHAGGVDSGLLAAYVYAAIGFQAASHRRSAGDELPEALRRAVGYLQRNAGGNPAVGDVADYCGVSRAHLFALFRRHLGTSPHRYLLKLRLAQAKIRLSDSGDPIKEIALECGFDSLEVFYRQFKAAVGATPGAYRKRGSPYPLR